MSDLSSIRCLTLTEVTMELLRLCAEAGPVERRMILMSFCGDDRGVQDSASALAKLADMIGLMPEEERRIQLYFARRLVVVGQRHYGRFDLSLPRRDHKPASVELSEELSDALVYALEDSLRSGSSPFLKETNALMRDVVTALIRRETL